MSTRRPLLCALAGVVSAAAGEGLAMPVATAYDTADPARALGEQVVVHTPAWLKDAAISAFGTDDKLVLLASVYTVMAVLAALTGVLAVRRRPAGLLLAATLNLVALAAAQLTQQGSVSVSAGTLLPGLVSLVVGVGLLALLTSHRVLGPPSDGVDRRAFLALALGGGAAAIAGGAVAPALSTGATAARARVRLPRAARPATAIPRGAELDVPGITPYLTTNRAFYRIDTALQVPRVDPGSWRLRIHGMVERELNLSYADILRMPLVEKRITLTCVSNEVGGTLAGNATWLGVHTKNLLAMARPLPGADAVRSTSTDAMTIGTPTEALTDDRGAMLAVGMNGRPLPLEHGFPARLVTPGLYGYVSATKWVTDLELTRLDGLSVYWTQRGYAKEAPIHTESRIDTPRQLSTLQAGRIPVAGVAWAQNTGIRAVEVKVDDGPWRRARLATEDTHATWRQWVYEWDATPGDHVVTVRATDDSGYTQTPHRTPPRPDGATGWHTTNVTVS